MRIRKLVFKNINNLKGEHTVDFTSEPLASSGLFAITGPTGSGKSTLLDVITLALFNKIPRFSKSISKNEITNSGSVVTHHTTEAAASIEYETRGQTYTSAWSIKTARTGNLKDYEMFIYDSNGKPLDIQKRDVPAHNENIIGLNYDQFIKSILLSQGEFAKFLKADKNERGELLENITGTSIYRNLGMKAYERWKISKANLETESAAIKEIKTLTENEKKELLSEASAIDEKQTEIDAILREAQNIAQIKTAISQTTTSLSKVRLRKEAMEKSLLEFIPYQKKLDLHTKLSPIQGPLATYNSAKENAIQSQKNLDEYKVDLKNAKEGLEKAITEMQVLTKVEVNEASFKNVMSAFEDEVNKMDYDLINIKAKGKEERQRNDKIKTNYPIQLPQGIKAEEAIVILQKRAQALQYIINASDIKNDKHINEAKTQLKEKRATINSLKEIHQNYEHISTLESKTKTLDLDIKKHKADIIKLKPLIEKCQNLDTSLKDNILLLRKQKEDAIKIAKLESLRSDLSEGDPCPLCGALSHPYSEHNPEADKNSIEEQIKTSIEKAKTNSKELESHNKEYTTKTTTIDHLTTNQKTISQELSELSKINTQAIASLSITDKIEPQSITTLITKKNQEVEETEKALEAIQEIQLNTELTESYNKLASITESFQKLNIKRKEKYEGGDISSITNELQDRFESNKSKITEMTAVIKKESDSLLRDQNLATQIESDLTPKLSQIGFQSITEVSNNILSEEHQIKITKQRDKLNHEKSSIETEINTLNQELQKLTTEDTKPDVELNALTEYITKQNLTKEDSLKRKGELTALINRDKEDQKQIQSKQKQIQKLTQEYEKWSLLKDMIGDAKGNSFSNFAQGLTLKNLLVYTNSRLKNLSDRYLLDMPGNDDALVIVDQYQGNTTRSVTTLSGGESFLVSLSLALSLSDMASKNTSIDSLFIDEGFGTLDQETLESAMTTLEKLQSDSQKTVGVISHVDALKERINVQIQMTKNAQGYSSISISS